MGKFDKYILISDLDGTLLKGENYISPKDIEAIKYFQKEGGKFSVATGRSLNRVKFIKEKLDIDLPVILLNGAEIVDINTEKILWGKYMHESVLEVIKDFNSKNSECGIIAFSKDKDYFINPEIFFEILGDLNDFRYVNATTEDIKLPVNKVVFYSHSDILEYLISEYKDYLDKLTFTKSDINFYEIIDKTVNKGNALEILKEMMNFNGYNLIAVGDNLNDLEMILKADLGVTAGHNCAVLYDVADKIIDKEDVIYNLMKELA